MKLCLATIKKYAKNTRLYIIVRKKMGLRPLQPHFSYIRMMGEFNRELNYLRMNYRFEKIKPLQCVNFR